MDAKLNVAGWIAEQMGGTRLVFFLGGLVPLSLQLFSLAKYFLIISQLVFSRSDLISIRIKGTLRHFYDIIIQGLI